MQGANCDTGPNSGIYSAGFGFLFNVDANLA